MSFEIKIGMSSAEIIQLAKEAGVSDEVIEKLNSVMVSDTDGKVSSSTEQYMLQAVVDDFGIFVPKAAANNVRQTNYGYLAEEKVDSLKVESIYNKQGKYSQGVVSSNKKGVAYKLSDKDGDGLADMYTETKKGETVREVDLKSVFDSNEE